MTATTVTMLAGLLLAGAVAVVAWRGLARARLLVEARGHRSALRWRSGTAHHVFEREHKGWSPELDAAMAAKLAELDRRTAEIVARRAGDRALGEDATRLGRDYESFGDLARALSECETAGSRPRPDLDDLLAVPPVDPGAKGRSQASGKPARSSRRAGPPPDAAAVARLGARSEELEARRTRLIQRIGDSSPDLWAKLAGSATSLAGEYERLHADATRVWARMFPDRAADRAVEEKAVFDHILDDIKRRASPRAAPRRPNRPRGHPSGEDHPGGSDL